MPKKKTDKKILPLEAAFKDILVCEKSDWRPYIETFVQEPENITEAGLGTLAGIFEITDQSEDSSYIVNYLVSVIKKEYYTKSKRGAVESLEAALHKANLALAKLAEHGNIDWIGHLNAILLVIEKKNVHLSQVGNARAFLLRGKVLVDITDGAQPIDNPHPLKTFTDVLSGRLENNDRLIITTGSIFDIFSLEEIKRSAIKFSPDEFTRFLHTALVNELERAAVLVVDLAEKEELDEAPSKIAHRAQKLNAFSQQAFSKAAPSSARHNSASTARAKPTKTEPLSEPLIEQEKKQALVSEIQDEMARNSREFVDKKTGHIYIKEDQFPHEENSKISELVENISLKTSHLGTNTRKKLGSLSKKLRGISLTGFFWEESEEDSPMDPTQTKREAINEFSQKQEERLPTKNISDEEAAIILSEARAATQKPRKTSPYKKYLENARAKAAPLAEISASKFARANRAAFQYLKNAGTATAKFTGQTSKKAKPFLKEKLARFKPKERADSGFLDVPQKNEHLTGTGDGQPEAFRPAPLSQIGIFSLLKKKFFRKKSDAVFRSGHNIAKKLGHRKLSELNPPQIKASFPAALPKSPPLDSTSPAKKVERISFDATPSAPSEKPTEGPSNFVDSRRIDDLFARTKKNAPHSVIQKNSAEEITTIKINPAHRTSQSKAKTLPSFKKIKNVTTRFDYSQKLYAVLTIMLLLIVPYLIVHWQNKRSAAENTTPQNSNANQTRTPVIPASEGGASGLTINSVYTAKNIEHLINLNGKIFAISSDQLIDIQNKTAYIFPGDFGSPKISLGMDDLNLIFLINDQNQIISWSPVSQKFQPETLTLPPNASVSFAKTYLTYLYILDQNNNQIYRYPRTENGFTAKTDWLKDNVNLSRVTAMAINGNIYLVDSKGNLTEYLDGQKQAFQIGSTVPALDVSNIYAKDGDKYIYVLDKTNGRIAKLDQNGRVISQYTDTAFKKAIDFTVDEAGSKIYVTNGTQVSIFSIN